MGIIQILLNGVSVFGVVSKEFVLSETKCLCMEKERGFSLISLISYTEQL